MTLNEYITKQRGNCLRLANALGVSSSYVSQMASGYRAIAPSRCLAIERATGGLVTRGDLRPHDCMNIWPDIAPLPQSGENPNPPRASAGAKESANA